MPGNVVDQQVLEELVGPADLASVVGSVGSVLALHEGRVDLVARTRDLQGSGSRRPAPSNDLPLHRLFCTTGAPIGSG